MGSERRYQATRQHLERARRAGKVPNIQLVSQAAGLAGAACGLWITVHFAWVAPGFLVEWRQATDRVYLFERAGFLLRLVLVYSVPVLLAILCSVVFFQVLAKGFGFRGGSLGPKLDNFNPARAISGIKQSLKRCWLRAALVMAITTVSLVVIRDLLVDLPFRLTAFLSKVQALFVGVLGDFCLPLIGIWSVAAGLEFWLARREYRKELLMNREEYERDLRENEGEPRYKSVRRAKHAELVLTDIATRVRRAKVIIVAR